LKPNNARFGVIVLSHRLHVDFPFEREPKKVKTRKKVKIEKSPKKDKVGLKSGNEVVSSHPREIERIGKNKRENQFQTGFMTTAIFFAFQDTKCDPLSDKP
jgi:hypothetical protein